MANQQPAPSSGTTRVFEAVPSGAYAPEVSEVLHDGARVRVFSYARDDSPAEDCDRTTEAEPVVLMVHGFRGDHHGLELIARALRARWDVLVPDLPGYGVSEPFRTLAHTAESYADLVADLAASLAPRPVVLVGHSFGSAVAVRAAARAQVAALVLINPICEPALESSARVPSLAASAFYRACRSLPDALGDRLARSRTVTRVSSELMMKTDDAGLRRFINGQHDAYFGAFADRRVVMESYDSSIRDTARDGAGQVSCPVLLIAAERDDLGSVPGQEALRDLFPDARLEVIPQVGHLIHYEAPCRAAAMIDGFAEETLAARAESGPGEEPANGFPASGSALPWAQEPRT